MNSRKEKRMVWPCHLFADTRSWDGKRRRIDARIEGAGDLHGAILRYMKKRPRAGDFLGVELKALTPLGQLYCIVYEGDITASREVHP